MIDADMAQVETELKSQSDSTIPLVRDIGSYVCSGGGKRVRPAILLLVARMCGYAGAAGPRLGAVVEMIHAATLVHDDIIDNSCTRRNQPSVNARWGSEISVLIGDWLYMTSFSVALAERQFRIVDILIEVTRKMVEGELIQLEFNGNLDITEDQHMDISMRKTAFLFSACSQLGGMLGGVAAENEERLRLYGLNIGLAFQLVDDVLDLTSDERTLGKPVQSDLKEGKLTLPLIYLMRDGTAQRRELVQGVLQNRNVDASVREEIAKLVRDCGAYDRVMEKARDYARKAHACLEGFPDGDARHALAAIPDYIIERDR
ncbi:MAG: polyprenyl synthetase family protein [Acidobacteriota bacterium]|nr:polyprenyl synthetase family protein [Acidobacteriota bacterium]